MLSMDPRMPIAISALEQGTCVVLCDDGTVWTLGVSNTVAKWQQLSGVPQPPEAPERRGLS
jgi:hypothetical protein